MKQNLDGIKSEVEMLRHDVTNLKQYTRKEDHTWRKNHRCSGKNYKNARFWSSEKLRSFPAAKSLEWRTNYNAIAAFIYVLVMKFVWYSIEMWFDETTSMSEVWIRSQLPNLLEAVRWSNSTSMNTLDGKFSLTGSREITLESKWHIGLYDHVYVQDCERCLSETRTSGQWRSPTMSR